MNRILVDTECSRRLKNYDDVPKEKARSVWHDADDSTYGWNVFLKLIFYGICVCVLRRWIPTSKWPAHAI